MNEGIAIDFDALVTQARQSMGLESLNKDETITAPATPPSDLFNVLQRLPGQGSRVMIFDARGREEWSRGHIRDSIPVEINRETGIVTVSTGGSQELLLLRGSVLAIIYDQDTTIKDTISPQSQLYYVIRSLKREGTASKITFLDGGYARFLSSYPYLCILEGITDETWPKLRLPAEILPGQLYLGDQSNCSTEQLSLLNIRAVLTLGVDTKPEWEVDQDLSHESKSEETATQAPFSFQKFSLKECIDMQSDFLMKLPTVVTGSSVVWLTCDIDDDPTQLLPLSEAIDFITACVYNNRTTLVCSSSGKSRSAAVVIGYIMMLKG